MLTAEQLEMRRRGIGASEAPILADCDGYGRTLWALYALKVENIRQESSFEMELGNDLEPGVLKHYKRRLDLASSGMDLHQPGTLFSKETPWMFATPDSVVVPASDPKEWKWNVQVKVVAAHKTRLFGDGPSDVPDHMNLQVQWEMAVTGLRRTHLVVLIGGVDFRVYTIDYDEEIVGGLKYLGERFWEDHVLPRKPPPMDGSAAASQYLRSLVTERPEQVDYRSMSEEEKRAIATIAERGLRARASIKRWEIELEKARQELQLVVGTKRGISGSYGDISFNAQRQTSKGKVRWRDLAESLGASADQIKKFQGEPSSKFVLKGSIKGEAFEEGGSDEHG